MYYSINFHESLHFDQLAFTEKHMNNPQLFLSFYDPFNFRLRNLFLLNLWYAVLQSKEKYFTLRELLLLIHIFFI